MTLVVHRPRLTAALHRSLAFVPHPRAATLAEAHALHFDGHPPKAGAAPRTAAVPLPAPARINLPSLDRLVSYDSPSPCLGPCTPAPIDWRHRPAPEPLTCAQAAEAARRIHATTAHPQLAAALASTLFTGASFQQLATARSDDFYDAPGLLALHDRTRFTDGCATHPVPPWAGAFLRAATRYANLTGTIHMLAGPGDRPAVLGLADKARLRPPQPPAAVRTGKRGSVVWDWREAREAHGYGPAPADR
ncbi:hypothetical protein [Streptomyces sp. NPDC005262]|uniref:hypothetical protein n=1 Tax=Streptomyces sp. NPDC005262 TaxID=3364710 RepID=UPI0036B962D6